MTPESLTRVAVVGSINVDLTAHVARLPTPGETVAGGVLRRGIGGKGANQAVAAARLGAAVRMIGAVGDDSEGHWLRARIAEAGVDVDHVALTTEPSGTALLAVDADGENHIVVCPGANGLVSTAGVTFHADEAILTQLEIAMHVVTEIGETTPNFLAVNAAPAQPLQANLLRRADLFIVNETEFDLMPELRGAALVAVTYGAAGAALRRHGEEIARVPGLATKAVNSVGAGDAFCAALVLALRTGAGPQAALRTACAVGAAAVADESTQPMLRPLHAYSDGAT